LECEADHSPSSSVELRNAWTFTSTPFISSWHGALTQKQLYFYFYPRPDYTFTVAATKKQEEIALFVQRIESLKTELEIEQQQGASLRQKLEVATQVEQEKIKLQKEVR